MRRFLVAALAVLVAGCASAPSGGRPPGAPWRLLLTGGVDLQGPAAEVAATDPEGVLLEIRLLARSADLAVVIAARAAAGPLLAGAGFDLVACPVTWALPSPAGDLPPGPLPAVQCPGQLRPSSLTPPGEAEAPVTIVLQGSLPVGSGPARVAVSRLGNPRLAVTGLAPLLDAVADAVPEGDSVLEVLLGDSGVVAYRLGHTDHNDLRVRFRGWSLPDGDAVLLDGEWWELARPVVPAAPCAAPDLTGFTFGAVTAASVGDVTGDGALDLAVSYRHPFRETAVSAHWPGAVGVDAAGRSAHLGVFTLAGDALWAAGFIPHPVGALAACDGALALAYTGLDDPGVVATGAAVWQQWSLRPAADLPGPGIPGCADVDGDGDLDPIVLGRAP